MALTTEQKAQIAAILAAGNSLGDVVQETAAQTAANALAAQLAAAGEVTTDLDTTFWANTRTFESDGDPTSDALTVLARLQANPDNTADVPSRLKVVYQAIRSGDSLTYTAGVLSLVKTCAVAFPHVLQEIYAEENA